MGATRKYDYAHAADIYTAALSTTQHPTKTLRDTLDITPAAAAMLVSKLRARGMIPPADPRRPRRDGPICDICGLVAGPHFIVSTNDSRGRKIRDTVTVCGTQCLRKVHGV